MVRVKGPARVIRQAKVTAVVRARAMQTTAEAVDVVGAAVDVADVGGVLVALEVPLAGQRMPGFLANRGSLAAIRRRIGATKEATGATAGRVLNLSDTAKRVVLRSGKRVLRPGIGNPADGRTGVRMNRRHRPGKPDRTVLTG